MTAPGTALELRMRWPWRILCLAIVVVFGPLIVGVSVANLVDGRGSLGADLLVVLLLIATLGMPVVIPCAAALVRLARGIPDVRIDDQGIVWGSDRSRDLQIDWADVEGVTIRVFRTRDMTDRLVVIRPSVGASVRRPRGVWGRVLGAGQDFVYGSRFTISTAVEDAPIETIRAAIIRHHGRPIEEA